MLVEVNWVAILIAAVVGFLVGGLWYSPVLFGKQWMKLAGIHPNKSDQKKAMMTSMPAMFVAGAVMAYVLAVLLKLTGTSGVLDGAVMGFWAWVGFVATTSLGEYLFMKKPLGLYLINVGQHLANLLVMGAVIGYWS